MENRPLKILVSGASGTIGSTLVPFLESLGYVVDCLHRKDPEAHLYWDPEKSIIRASLEGYDAVINLAGFPVASGRWTKRRKRKIEESRLMATALLVERIKKCQKKPAVFISASGISYYGADGFLATLCQKWEEKAFELTASQVRVVVLRIGMVLSRNGGALKSLLPLFRLGLGGKLGSGKQMMSWIGIDDLVSIIHFALTSQIQGPVDAVAGVVTNEEFTKTLAHVLHRPAFLHVPAFLLRLLFGEMAEEMLLCSLSIEPKELLRAGFQFQTRDLETALRGQC